MMNSETTTSINIYVTGGGLFSLFHQFLEKILKIDDTKYNQIRMLIRNKYCTVEHLFDNVFRYDNIDEFVSLPFDTNTYQSFLKVNLFSQFDRLQRICSKFKFHTAILDAVNANVVSKHIGINTLGIHIRLTDMNALHPEHGIKTIDNYIENTQRYIQCNSSISNIFIASDNNESIEIFQRTFPTMQITYISDAIRCEYITSDNMQLQIQNYNTPEFVKGNVIESLTLSKCGALIHRISDFANFAILFSSSFKDIICI